MTEHVVLMGDSIFDNTSYTKGLPDVVTHLRGLLPASSQASLVAIDGSTTADLADQVNDVPSDVTRVVLSVGGNDALLNADILNLPVASTQEALLLFGRRVMEFEQSPGGAKIARAIAATRDWGPSNTSSSRVFAG